MLAGKKIRDLAKIRATELDKSSNYYLVKLKYKGIKEIELFALESISGKGVRDFGWVLLGFSGYGIGGRGGIISLDKKSAWLDGDLVTSGVVPNSGIAKGVHTNAAHYVPLTKYENIIIKKVTKNTLVLQDGWNHDTYTIKRGSADDDFANLANFIRSKKGDDTVDKGLVKLSKNIGLRFEVGQDEHGKHFIANFSKVGHFVSSGHVGSGHASFDESAFVTSLIQNYTPYELKFVMVDPKQVQLVPYEGMPYLARPVIYAPDETKKAVDDLLDVMDGRFEMFAEEGVNNIDEYNQKGLAAHLEYTVLLVPEIADLMMVDAKFYTDAFTKLAMKSKAAGIYMYLGTQRPSKDVLPDALLAHIFGRLVFATVNEADAERLLPGRSREIMSLKKAGELIYSDIDTPAVKLQANYVSDEQVVRLINKLKEDIK